MTPAAGSRQLLRLLTEGVPAGRRLLGAWTFGDRAVIGPEMTAGHTGCWCCAALRLGAGTDAADSADLWASVGPAAPLGTPAPLIGGPLAGMLGNLLAFEVFRLVTGALPAETRGQLVVQDLDSLDVLTEPLLPHPRCPYCSAAPEGEHAERVDALRTAHPEDESAAAPADGAADEDAARAALAALEERDVLVREAAGVFTAYADDEWEQTPLKIGTVRLGLAPGRTREVSAVDVHHVAGARLNALFRAAEVYAEHVVPPQVLTAAALEAAAGKWTRLAPAELAVSSGLDVPADRIAHFSEATSLLDGRTVLVPAGAVRTFGGWNDAGLFERTSAGTGAAGTPGPRSPALCAPRSPRTRCTPPSVVRTRYAPWTPRPSPRTRNCGSCCGRRRTSVSPPKSWTWAARCCRSCSPGSPTSPAARPVGPPAAGCGTGRPSWRRCAICSAPSNCAAPGRVRRR